MSYELRDPTFDGTVGRVSEEEPDPNDFETGALSAIDEQYHPSSFRFPSADFTDPHLRVVTRDERRTRETLKSAKTDVERLDGISFEQLTVKTRSTTPHPTTSTTPSSASELSPLASPATRRALSCTRV